jgi:predicted DNA-binding transcriptional regulator YafY
MATNKNALLRYMIIDRCIRNNMAPYPSRNTLQKKISEELWEEISVSQVDKDLNALKLEHNAPIEYHRIKKGYYYTDEQYSFRNSINEEDLWVLDFAAAAVQVYGHSDINEKFLNLSDRLHTGKNKGREKIAPAYSCIQIEGSSTKQGYEWLFDLYLHINQHQVVRIDYSPFGREASKHTLSPYLLKQYQNRWYLVGYSNERKRTQVFALDRIQKMHTLKQTYLLDPDFDPYSYFRHSFGVHHSYEVRPEKVQLLFNERQRPYILSLPLHPTQKILRNDKKGLLIEIEIFCKGNNDFFGKVLSYGDEVEVVKPEYLKAEIIMRARSIVEK